jgi:hypothetical protein
METDFEAVPGETQELDAMYYQCRSAKLAGRQDTFVGISHDSSFGKIVTVQSPQIGSLEDHCNIRETFHGSRVMRGNAVVNESLSCSFNPAKLVCISCACEHSVVGKDPVVVLFSDQNFVASLACEKEKCINVVRLENASLLDLLEFAKELFSNCTRGQHLYVRLSLLFGEIQNFALCQGLDGGGRTGLRQLARSTDLSTDTVGPL